MNRKWRYNPLFSVFLCNVGQQIIKNGLLITDTKAATSLSLYPTNDQI